MFSPKNIVLKKEKATSVLGMILSLNPSEYAVVPEKYSFAILKNFQKKNTALNPIPKSQRSNKLGNQSEDALGIASEIVPPTTTAGN